MTNAGQRLKLSHVLHGENIFFGRPQIIVENMSRAKIQASAVCEHEKLFFSLFASLAQKTHTRKIAVIFPLQIERVEKIAEVFHRLYRADAHVHRGTHADVRKMRFNA